MKKTFALLLWGMLVSPTSAGEISSWEPVQDGNMIVTLRTVDKDGIHEVQYKYHLKGLPIRLKSCDEVQRSPKMNEIWLITQEARPYMYIIQDKYNAYKPVGESTWIGVDPLGQDLSAPEYDH